MLKKKLIMYLFAASSALALLNGLPSDTLAAARAKPVKDKNKTSQKRKNNTVSVRSSRVSHEPAGTPHVRVPATGSLVNTAPLLDVNTSSIIPPVGRVSNVSVIDTRVPDAPPMAMDAPDAPPIADDAPPPPLMDVPDAPPPDLAAVPKQEAAPKVSRGALLDQIQGGVRLKKVQTNATAESGQRPDVSVKPSGFKKAVVTDGQRLKSFVESIARDNPNLLSDKMRKDMDAAAGVKDEALTQQNYQKLADKLIAKMPEESFQNLLVTKVSGLTNKQEVQIYKVRAEKDLKAIVAVETAEKDKSKKSKRKKVINEGGGALLGKKAKASKDVDESLSSKVVKVAETNPPAVPAGSHSNAKEDKILEVYKAKGKIGAINDLVASYQEKRESLLAEKRQAKKQNVPLEKMGVAQIESVLKAQEKNKTFSDDEISRYTARKDQLKREAKERLNQQLAKMEQAYAQNFSLDNVSAAIREGGTKELYGQMQQHIAEKKRLEGSSATRMTISLKDFTALVEKGVVPNEEEMVSSVKSERIRDALEQIKNEKVQVFKKLGDALPEGELDNLRSVLSGLSGSDSILGLIDIAKTKLEPKVVAPISSDDVDGIPIPPDMDDPPLAPPIDDAPAPPPMDDGSGSTGSVVKAPNPVVPAVKAPEMVSKKPNLGDSPKFQKKRLEMNIGNIQDQIRDLKPTETAQKQDLERQVGVIEQQIEDLNVKISEIDAARATKLAAGGGGMVASKALDQAEMARKSDERFKQSIKYAKTLTLEEARRNPKDAYETFKQVGQDIVLEKSQAQARKKILKDKNLTLKQQYDAILKLRADALQPKISERDFEAFLRDGILPTPEDLFTLKAGDDLQILQQNRSTVSNLKVIKYLNEISKAAGEGNPELNENIKNVLQLMKKEGTGTINLKELNQEERALLEKIEKVASEPRELQVNEQQLVEESRKMKDTVVKFKAQIYKAIQNGTLEKLEEKRQKKLKDKQDERDQIVAGLKKAKTKSSITLAKIKSSNRNILARDLELRAIAKDPDRAQEFRQDAAQKIANIKQEISTLTAAKDQGTASAEDLKKLKKLKAEKKGLQSSMERLSELDGNSSEVTAVKATTSSQGADQASRQVRVQASEQVRTSLGSEVSPSDRVNDSDDGGDEVGYYIEYDEQDGQGEQSASEQRQSSTPTSRQTSGINYDSDGDSFSNIEDYPDTDSEDYEQSDSDEDSSFFGNIFDEDEDEEDEETQTATDTERKENNKSRSIVQVLKDIFSSDGDSREKAEEANIAIEAHKSQAVQDLINDPSKTVELVESLKQAGITLDQVENAADDNVASNLSNNQKALAYLAASQNLSKEEISKEQRKFALQGVVTPVSIVSDLISNVLSNRVNEITNNAVGVAAGDGDENSRTKRLWVSGVFGSGKQKGASDQAGYKSSNVGGAVGADISFGDNEANLIGLSYGQVHSGFKMNQARKGDKIKAESHVFSVYGQAEIMDNVLLQGSGSAIKSKITAKSPKLLGDGTYKTATGKFKSTGYNFNSSVSYLLKTDDLVIMPSLGLKYGKTHDGAYNETGTGVYNLSVASRSSSSLSGVAGFKVMLPTKLSDETNITPFINTSAERLLNHKEKAAKVKLQWADQTFDSEIKSGNRDKMAYNIGTGVLVKHKNIEVSANYNYNFKKKYSSHQGSLKLEIKF